MPADAQLPFHAKWFLLNMVAVGTSQKGGECLHGALHTYHSKGKLGMNKKAKAGVLLYLLAYAVVCHASDTTTCSDSVLYTVADHYQLEHVDSGKGSRVLADSCKIWPHDPRLTLSVIAYDRGPGKADNDPDEFADIYVSVYDNQRQILLNTYKYTIGEDATTQVGNFTFDTAQYRLAKHVFAFGVRFENAANLSHAADPDFMESNHLTLFIRKGHTLQPVLKQFMTVESYTWDKDRHQVQHTDLQTGSVHILPSVHHGLHDLVLLFKAQDEGTGKDESKMNFRSISTFNGNRYTTPNSDGTEGGWDQEDGG